MKIRVLVGLASALANKRELRCAYKTNRAYKAATLYTYFKSKTTAGVITRIEDQMSQITKDLNVSRATIYNWLRYAQDLNLIRLEVTKRLAVKYHLASYDQVADHYHLHKQTITIVKDEKIKLEYYLKALEYKEAREHQQKGYYYKILRNPVILDGVQIAAAQFGTVQNVEFNTETLHQLQRKLFSAGGSEAVYNTLFLANPDFNRSLQTEASNKATSHMNAKYERTKLSKLGLLQVQKRNPIICDYRRDIPAGYIRGRLSNKRRRYNEKTGKAVWYLPDNITLNPLIFSNAPPRKRAPYGLSIIFHTYMSGNVSYETVLSC